MKKNIALALCLILGGNVLSSCSNSTQRFEEKSYLSKTTIHEIHLDVRDRKIEVTLSKDEQVHIYYYESSKEYYDISIFDENVLKMVSVNNKEWIDYIGLKPSANNRKILLQIPETLLKNLTLSTTNEDITIAPLLKVMDAHVSSNGGNINFENLNVENALYLSAKNGNIFGTIDGIYNDFAIWSKTKKGSSNLPEKKEDGIKTLNVISNNGDVNIEFINK